MSNFIFNFPDIGEGLTEGVVVEWLVKKGQQVKSGDILVTMETDKVVAEIPSPKTGTIVNMFGKPGDTIKVGQALVEIETEESQQETKQEMVEEEGAGVVGTLEVASNAAVMKASNEGLEDEQKTNEIRKKVLSTPVARALAKDLGVDIQKIKGTGPAGRVTKQDVLNFANKVSVPDVKVQKQDILSQEDLIEEVEMSQIRKVIAQNMIKSKHNAAHMALFDDVEIGKLYETREKFKELYLKEGIKLTFLPFILKAVALSLKKHKQLNSQMDMEQGKIYYKKFYNIGIAVDTERGLVVPVIRNVDKLSIKEIALKIQELTKKSDENKLTLEDLKDGTFSVTNYGSVGGKYAFPVINYPQAAILGIGKIFEQPIVKDGKIEIGKMLPLSISVDHRIVDGAEVSRFFGTLMSYLKEPMLMTME